MSAGLDNPQQLVERIAEDICNRRWGHTDNHAGHTHTGYYDHIEITARHLGNVDVEQAAKWT